MESHPALSQMVYRAGVYKTDGMTDDEKASFDEFPRFHIVQSCIPTDVPVSECSQSGHMLVVVGQEIYDDSPFTREIESIMGSDVNRYYLFIVLIFFIVKCVLFLVLWSWLRIRVTERIINLTKKLKNNDQNEQSNFHKMQT